MTSALKSLSSSFGSPARPRPGSPLVGRRRTASPARQRGVTLFIALITVVAMSLVAVAMYRSVDIATLQSGNIAMMSDQSNKGDLCVRRAITWMTSGAVNMQAGTDDLAHNYHGVQFTPAQLNAKYSMPAQLISSSDNSWMGSAPDIDAGDGVRVNCVIERVCKTTAAADTSHCEMSMGSLGGQGKDCPPSGCPPSVASLPAFRVSTRVDGVKGVVFSQVTLGPRLN